MAASGSVSELVPELIPELVPELVSGSKTPVKLLVKRQSATRRQDELKVVDPDPRPGPARSRRHHLDQHVHRLSNRPAVALASDRRSAEDGNEVLIRERRGRGAPSHAPWIPTARRVPRPARTRRWNVPGAQRIPAGTKVPPAVIGFDSSRISGRGHVAEF